ncbi:Lipase [Parasponia andersonii]|uniref:Lipase n=1 Tax=Parasponia andersonii TaxID=3476 RepID=A0A2P5DXB1_PARAD|nr:Lipase [Parasponia andersonii]
MEYYLTTNKNLQALVLLLLIIFLHPVWFIPKAQAVDKKNNKASAVLVFGDSTADPGNNNYVSTIFKSNFPPYGRDFANRKPTGRFTNGRLTTDFLASYVGLKEYVPPYLDPNLSTKELMTGVSFASAGSGYDPLTSQLSNVIPILKQLEYFKEYKKRLESAIGKQQTENHINKAIFVISAGTNDFIVNYFTIPIRRKIYTTLSSYDLFLMQHVKHFLQNSKAVTVIIIIIVILFVSQADYNYLSTNFCVKSLWAEGARRIAVVGLPPMGCLPAVITLNSPNAFQSRGCIEKYCSVARDYNKILQNELHFMQRSLAIFGARIAYVDIYEPVIELIKEHKRYGFDEIYNGCCGTGYLEASFLCNPLSYACPDANKYMFWDSIHPTEKTYNYAFKSLRPVVDSILKG